MREAIAASGDTMRFNDDEDDDKAEAMMMA